MKFLSVIVILLISLLLFSCGKDSSTNSDNPNGGDTTGTITDIDGNIYQVIKIGNQNWMAENLRVTHYRNGDEIPNEMDSATWSTLWDGSIGAYCDYNNDVANAVTYGKLYNWYAVNDNRNLAPAGWHVPSQVEWQALIDHLGGSTVAGGKMKETGTSHWISPNTDASNESGFSALPGGYRHYYYGFVKRRYLAYFWSSTEHDANDAWQFYLENINSEAILEVRKDKPCGFSIRCVKD